MHASALHESQVELFKLSNDEGNTKIMAINAWHDPRNSIFHKSVPFKKSKFASSLTCLCLAIFSISSEKNSGRLQNLSTAIGESCLFDIRFMRISMLHVLSRCNILTSSSNTNYTFTVRSKPTETWSTTVHFNLRGLWRDLLAVDTAEFELVIQAMQCRTR